MRDRVEGRKKRCRKVEETGRKEGTERWEGKKKGKNCRKKQEVRGRNNRLLSLIRHGPLRKRCVQQF
jgi:hypothetical protein